LPLLAVIAVGVVAQGMAFAQSTGDISGTVVDMDGSPMPGVTVTVKSPSAIGANATVTGPDGRYRLLNLPPGVYTVTASLAGFSTVEKTGVRVEIGKSYTIKMTMQLTAKESVTVTGEGPVVDTASTTIGTIVNADQFTRLPIARDYSQIAQTAPGVNADPVGATVYGSSGAENVYVIDGVNTTGVETGLQGKSLNMEFIQEVEVKNGGYEAEYGRSTGGILNVVTKSGGNAFHGDVFGYFDNDSLQATNDHTGEIKVRNSTGPSLQTGFTKKDFGADLGGYFVLDRVWFFAAYDRVDNRDNIEVFKDIRDFAEGAPPPGSEFELKTKNDLYSGKFTLRPAESLNIVASVFGDPGDQTGPIRVINGPTSTFLGKAETGGLDGSLRLSLVAAPSVIFNLQGGYHEEKNEETPGPGGSAVQYRDRNQPQIPLTGGIGFYQLQNFKRYSARADVTAYVGHLAGDHEFKFGGEYEQPQSENSNIYSGGQRIDQRFRSGFGVFYLHRFFTTGAATLDNPEILPVLTTAPETDNYALFLQDSWKITRGLTANVGIRWDRQVANGDNPLGGAVEPFELPGATSGKLETKNNWSPRIGLIWDPMADGKSKIFASYGKFYETIPMDLNIRAFGGERIAFMNNASPDPAVITDGNVPGRASSIFGNPGEPVDSDLKGQYVTEIIFGVEREVAPNFAVGVKGLYRSLDEVIEDYLCDIPTGNYCIGNPGSGIMKQVFYYDPVSGDITAVDAAKPSRYYRGIELTATKRFSDNWSMIASYVYSTLKGNYDGTFQNSTGQLDPNINSAYDYANFSVNNDGYLSSDRKHQAKISASYQFPFRLILGLSAFYQTGLPLTTRGYYDNYSNYELYLTRRGQAIGEDRTPSTYEASLHVGYPVQIGPVEVNLLVDVFNLLNQQKATRIDQRWGFNQDDNYNLVDASTGLILPGSHSASDAPNPDYLKATAWQAPREVRFGLKVSF
jgi:outer membrane receptor protein involved in Fe transport